MVMPFDAAEAQMVKEMRERIEKLDADLKQLTAREVNLNTIKELSSLAEPLQEVKSLRAALKDHLESHKFYDDRGPDYTISYENQRINARLEKTLAILEGKEPRDSPLNHPNPFAKDAEARADAEEPSPSYRADSKAATPSLTNLKNELKKDLGINKAKPSLGHDVCKESTNVEALSNPKCPKCGEKLVVDLTTLDNGIWYCPNLCEFPDWIVGEPCPWKPSGEKVEYDLKEFIGFVDKDEKAPEPPKYSVCKFYSAVECKQQNTEHCQPKKCCSYDCFILEVSKGIQIPEIKKAIEAEFAETLLPTIREILRIDQQLGRYDFISDEKIKELIKKRLENAEGSTP